MFILDRSFYTRDSITVARELLGKNVVRRIGGNELVGRIVETEAYMGYEDKAAHSYKGRRTERNEIMYHIGGYSYVYMIYGMYYCVNAVAAVPDIPQAALIRAVEPLSGLEEMSQNRFSSSYTSLTKAQVKNLTSGPGKLCKAMSIDKRLNGVDLCSLGELYICDENPTSFEIASSPRIGIDYAEEYKDVPWRFFIKDNIFVSKTKSNK